jgi:hypothetical protein
VIEIVALSQQIGVPRAKPSAFHPPPSAPLQQPYPWIEDNKRLSRSNSVDNWRW